MKIKRILMEIPFDNVLYVRTAEGLRKGFQGLGVDFYALSPNLDDAQRKRLLDKFRPDVILAINSCRTAPVVEYLRAVHISWVQDNHFLGQDVRELVARDGTSDLVYFTSERLKGHCGLDGTAKVGIFRFGTQLREASRPASYAMQASMIGFIHEASLRDLELGLADRPHVTGHDYCAFLEQALGSSVRFPQEQVRSLVPAFLAHLGLDPRATSISRETGILLRETLLRGFQRARLVRAVLGSGFSCSLFGLESWATWPEFAPHFAGPALDEEVVTGIHRASRIILHTGAGIGHPRVLDAAAAGGGVVLANTGQDEDEAIFRAGEHYLACDLDTLPEMLGHYLRDDAAHEKVRAAAYEHVRANHTWERRAAQILDDVRSL